MTKDHFCGHPTGQCKRVHTASVIPNGFDIVLDKDDPLISHVLQYNKFVSNMKDAQRMKNYVLGDLLAWQNIGVDFEKYFDERVDFGFGMGWIKPIVFKFCMRVYFEGYKLGMKSND